MHLFQLLHCYDKRHISFVDIWRTFMNLIWPKKGKPLLEFWVNLYLSSLPSSFLFILGLKPILLSFCLLAFLNFVSEPNSQNSNNFGLVFRLRNHQTEKSTFGDLLLQSWSEILFLAYLLVYLCLSTLPGCYRVVLPRIMCKMLTAIISVCIMSWLVCLLCLRPTKIYNS